jgi:G:T-mismatch repair DNA endonuclease (very short patch repair protein)
MSFLAPSVDRLDNSKGYIKGNVVLICWRCNNLKSDSSIEKLEKIVRWLSGYKNSCYEDITAR